MGFFKKHLNNKKKHNNKIIDNCLTFSAAFIYMFGETGDIINKKSHTKYEKAYIINMYVYMNKIEGNAFVLAANK